VVAVVVVVVVVAVVLVVAVIVVVDVVDTHVPQRTGQSLLMTDAMFLSKFAA